MIVWRICKKRFLKSAFSGTGAKKIGGRWNHKGVALVYTSTNLSLAVLELFVHLVPDLIPDDMNSISAELPKNVSLEELTAKELPRNWRDYPAPEKLVDLGSAWAKEQRSLVFIVPSVVNPEERNVLINPEHSEFKNVKIGKAKPFQFDPRMWKN